MNISVEDDFGKVHFMSIPRNWRVVKRGKLKSGDKSYSPIKEIFRTPLNPGCEEISLYFCVIRRNKSKRKHETLS